MASTTTNPASQTNASHPVTCFSAEMRPPNSCADVPLTTVPNDIRNQEKEKEKEKDTQTKRHIRIRSVHVSPSLNRSPIISRMENGDRVTEKKNGLWRYEKSEPLPEFSNGTPKNSIVKRSVKSTHVSPTNSAEESVSNVSSAFSFYSDVVKRAKTTLRPRLTHACNNQHENSSPCALPQCVFGRLQQFHSKETATFASNKTHGRVMNPVFWLAMGRILLFAFVLSATLLVGNMHLNAVSARNEAEVVKRLINRISISSMVAPLNIDAQSQNMQSSASTSATFKVSKDNTHFDLEPFHIPIVLYVHKRPQYYRQVVEALRNVTGINRTTLVVSHDVADAEMFNITQSIDFMSVRLLLHPEPYSHASPFRLKRHWAWLQQQLWTNIFPNYDGDIAFIEEDHLLSPDSYQVLKVLSCMKKTGVVPASVVTLFTYNEDRSFSDASFMAHVHDDDNVVLNAGYAFNRTLWELIRSDNEPFEKRDNWDCALGDVMEKHGFLLLSAWISRVRNVGETGIHSDQMWCALQRAGRIPISQRRQLDDEWFKNVELWIRKHSADKPQLVCRGYACYGDSQCASARRLPTFSESTEGLTAIQNSGETPRSSESTSDSKEDASIQGSQASTTTENPNLPVSHPEASFEASQDVAQPETNAETSSPSVANADPSSTESQMMTQAEPSYAVASKPKAEPRLEESQVQEDVQSPLTNEEPNAAASQGITHAETSSPFADAEPRSEHSQVYAATPTSQDNAVAAA